MLRKWLKAGFLEKHAWFATTEGTPQGGIISPALANLDPGWTATAAGGTLRQHAASNNG